MCEMARLTIPITFQLPPPPSPSSCGSLKDISHINEHVENCKLSYSLGIYVIYTRIMGRF